VYICTVYFLLYCVSANLSFYRAYFSFFIFVCLCVCILCILFYLLPMPFGVINDDDDDDDDSIRLCSETLLGYLTIFLRMQVSAHLQITHLGLCELHVQLTFCPLRY